MSTKPSELVKWGNNLYRDYTNGWVMHPEDTWCYRLMQEGFDKASAVDKADLICIHCGQAQVFQCVWRRMRKDILGRFNQNDVDYISFSACCQCGMVFDCKELSKKDLLWKH